MEHNDSAEDHLQAQRTVAIVRQALKERFQRWPTTVRQAAEWIQLLEQAAEELTHISGDRRLGLDLRMSARDVRANVTARTKTLQRYLPIIQAKEQRTAQENEAKPHTPANAPSNPTAEKEDTDFAVRKGATLSSGAALTTLRRIEERQARRDMSDAARAAIEERLLTVTADIAELDAVRLSNSVPRELRRDATRLHLQLVEFQEQLEARRQQLLQEERRRAEVGREAKRRLSAVQNRQAQRKAQQETRSRATFAPAQYMQWRITIDEDLRRMRHIRRENFEQLNPALDSGNPPQAAALERERLGGFVRGFSQSSGAIVARDWGGLGLSCDFLRDRCFDERFHGHIALYGSTL